MLDFQTSPEKAKVAEKIFQFYVRFSRIHGEFLWMIPSTFNSMLDFRE